MGAAEACEHRGEVSLPAHGQGVPLQVEQVVPRHGIGEASLLFGLVLRDRAVPAHQISAIFPAQQRITQVG